MLTSLNRIISIDINEELRNPNLPRHVREEKLRTKKTLEELYFFMLHLLHLQSPVRQKIELIYGAIQILVRNLSLNASIVPSEYPPIVYQQLPEYLFQAPITFLNFLIQVDLIRVSIDGELVNMITTLFSNRNYIPNPTVAFEIVQFYSSILFNKNINYMLLITSVIEKAFPSVIDFYSRCEATGTNSEYTDKYNFRPNCVKLLNYWLQFRECVDYFVGHSSSESISSFVYYLFKDCTDYVNKFHEDVTSDASSGEVEYFYDLMKNWICLFNKIASIKPALFEDKRFLQLPSLFFFSLRKYFDLGDKFQQIKRSNRFDFDPEFLFINMVTLAGSFKNDEVILKYFRDPAYGYNKEIIDLVLSRLKQFEKSYTFEIIENNFVEFSRNLEGIKLELEIPPEVAEDAPQDFVDCITYELLLDPVMLSTGTILNKSTYLQSLSLSGNKDPKNQATFDPEKTVELPELKEKVLHWVKEQMSQKGLG